MAKRNTKKISRKPERISSLWWKNVGPVVYSTQDKWQSDCGRVTIYRGKCEEVMSAMPDGCVDLVCTDPPYGVGLDYRSFDDTRENVAALARLWLPQARRIAPIVVFTPGRLSEWLYPMPTWVLSVSSPAAGSRCSWGWQNTHPVVVYGPDPYLANGLGARSDTLIFRTMSPSAPKHTHPCAKPIDFMRWIIDRCEPFNRGTVLDCFMGSGTTGEVAIKTNRRFIGIELDDRYFEVSKRRLQDVLLNFDTKSPLPRLVT
jgi:site-specific DNA-methyltransferase (adenine-specific)